MPDIIARAHSAHSHSLCLAVTRNSSTTPPILRSTRPQQLISGNHMRSITPFLTKHSPSAFSIPSYLYLPSKRYKAFQKIMFHVLRWTSSDGSGDDVGVGQYCCAQMRGQSQVRTARSISLPGRTLWRAPGLPSFSNALCTLT